MSERGATVRSSGMAVAAIALSMAATACIGGGSVGVENAKITDCANDGSQRVRVEVENVGSDLSNFAVDVIRRNAETGNRLDAISVPIEVVQPGETVDGYAFGEHYFDTTYTCEIVDVQTFGAS